MDIRAAKPDDAAAIARVHVESWRETYGGIVPDDYLLGLSHARREETWRGILAGNPPSSHVYVALDDQEAVVGFASGGRERTGDAQYTGEVYAIYLLAEHHGQGLGQRLFQSVVGRLREDGHSTLLLWVLADNPATGFYEHLGGSPVYDKEITIGGRPLTEIAYGWLDSGAILPPAHP